jgi:tetratricopeptide (TPR) repeat protein
MPVQSTPWIFSPLRDLTFILLTPLPILLTFAAARAWGWMDGLLAFGLALGMGHYLPGLFRAYGDRALFRRFRTRLIVAPLFLVTVTAYFAYLDLHIVILLSLLWGAWHWMMQVYGFARIYDAKTEPAARTPARLDQMLCLMWFGMCVFVLNTGMAGWVTRYYESGGPRLPSEAFLWFSRGWLIVTIVLTLIYLGYTVRVIRHGGRPNPLKLVFIAITFIYLSYTTSVAERPLMGLVLFESWHDIQYLAIVWMFNVSRTRKDPDAGHLIRFLFRPRVILVLAYIAACLVFGSLAHAWRLFDDEAVARIAVGLVAAVAMLHYYMDGFIWKIREQDTRQTLGVQDEAKVLPAQAFLIPAWARHALLWLLFAIPAGLFFVLETRGNVPRPLQIYERLVEAFPASPNAHYELGRELMNGGRFREAAAHFDQALALEPNMLPVRIIRGVIHADQREYELAKAHFEHALRLDPGNAEVHNNLGIVLDEQGDLQTAKTHLERALSIEPDYALAHNNLGTVLSKLGNLVQARIHHQHALRIDPNFSDAHYQLGLAMKLEGNLSEARTHFQEALRLNPGDARAQQHLAALEATLQR